MWRLLRYLIGVEANELVTTPLAGVEMLPVEMPGVFSLPAAGVFVLGEALKRCKYVRFMYNRLNSLNILRLYSFIVHISQN